MTVEQANEPSHEVVAELMEAPPVLCIVGTVGDTVAHRHVGITIDNGRQQTDGRLGGVGVVAIDHDVAVGVDVAEHRTHDVALASARLAANDCACRGGDVGRAVGGGVVVDVDYGLGQGGAEVAHHLGDGGCLVVAGNEDGSTGAAEGGGSIRLIISFYGLGRDVGHDSHVPRR